MLHNWRNIKEGLSPRGRGNRSAKSSSIYGERSIPTWAGQPGSGCGAIAGAAVYPRVGGATSSGKSFPASQMGLSPRGRGNLADNSHLFCWTGSIPAWAGQPSISSRTSPRRPKLEPFTAVIDQILVDELRRPRKQRHTAQRIFQRLRDEHGFGGQYTIVKDYVREHRRRSQEMFVPLSHPPGHAQCDFGEALVIIGGVEQKAHCFVLDLPHSDGCFVKAYPAETTEAFLDGHVSAFAFLGGVPQSILYDNTKLAVARILGDGRRKRTRAFTELQSHYLFSDRFGRPGKGNDKGKVEGMVGYMRRNFLVPVPSFESFDALNAHLERRCLARMDARLRGHSESIGQRMERDLEALLPLPPVAYDACEKQAGRVSSLSLVRYRTNDYSAPVAYGHRDVLVKGYVDRVVISCGSEVIARLAPV